MECTGHSHLCGNRQVSLVVGNGVLVQIPAPLLPPCVTSEESLNLSVLCSRSAVSQGPRLWGLNEPPVKALGLGPAQKMLVALSWADRAVWYHITGDSCGGATGLHDSAVRGIRRPRCLSGAMPGAEPGTGSAVSSEMQAPNLSSRHRIREGRGPQGCDGDPQGATRGGAVQAHGGAEGPAGGRMGNGSQNWKCEAGHIRSTTRTKCLNKDTI